MRKRNTQEWRCTNGARLLALCTLAAFVAGFGTVLATEPSSGSKTNTQLATFATGKPPQTPANTESLAPAIILYDQTSSLGPGSTSQNFEAIYDAYDNQGADDFVTTGPGWIITKVTVPGVYSAGGGPAPTVGVQFFGNAGGLPGALLCDYPAVVPVDAAGTFTLNLPSSCNIPGATTAWVSVFANLAASTNGQWFWGTRTILTGFPAAWQNPGDGFGTGCTSWAPRTACLGGTAPDMGFRLEGDLAACSVNSDCNDNNVCTDDVCNVGTGCVYTDNTAPCSDGNGCTTGDTCSVGFCSPGTPVVCNDGLFCTVETCDPGTGNCVVTGSGCDDGNSCTFDTCDEATDSCSTYRPPTVEFCNTGAITIGLLAGPGSPYPATIAVAGLPASSAVCTVRLQNISHTWSDDLDILLSGPGPGNAIVMSDVGGGVSVVNASVLLTDGAASSMPDGPSLLSGTYKPTNFGGGDVFSAPAPAPQGGSALGAFGAGNQNGNWNLWVHDDFNADGGTIAGGWCVSFVRSTCANDAECNDGNPCNGVETCVSSRCEAGTPVICDDGLFCTTDSCDTATGLCTVAPNTCDDGNTCTDDSCVEGTGCINANNTSPCDDGTLCTSGDTCAGGACVGTNACVQICSDPISIPEGGPATPYPSSITVSGVIYPAAVVSVELRGLSHTFPDDLDILLVGPVDDSQNIIVMSDAGGSADVVGINLIFSDSAATPISNTGPLASGTFQPANYDGGTDPDPFPAPAPPWSGSTSIATFNGNPNGTFDLFVLDEFAPDEGSLDSWCLNILQIGCTDASECDDGNFCTADACVNGGCENVFSTAACDDFNPCTTETCSQADGCGFVPNTCDDNNLCTADSCTDFVGCNNVPTVVCDDGNPTTTDTCDPATGTCVFTPACDDNDECTTDSSNAGQCVYTPITCDDGDACTTNSCDPSSGCVYPPLVCDDGVACTADTCNSGTGCVYTPNNLACDDGNACTDDVCTAAGCSYSNNSAPCDDGVDCTTGDVCSGGVCGGDTTAPNPKTKGFYKKACKNNQITAEEAACVAQTAPLTFGDVDTPAEVCNEINGHDSDLPGHDSDEKHCTKDETELLVAALNVCTGRVCESQPINSHDSDASNDPDPATVGEAIDEADAIFGDPDRTKDTCHDGKELVKDINNGHALEMDTLVLNKVAGGGTRLTWTPPYVGEDQTVMHYKVWRSIRGADAFVLIQTQTSTTFVDTAAGDFDYEVLVEIQD